MLGSAFFLKGIERLENEMQNGIMSRHKNLFRCHLAQKYLPDHEQREAGRCVLLRSLQDTPGILRHRSRVSDKMGLFH